MTDGNPAQRDRWAKAQAAATIFATIAIPIILSYVGFLFNDALKERDAELRVTELAIQILREDPKQQTSMPELRRWATQVINKYSGVPLSEQAIQELQQNSLLAALDTLVDLQGLYQAADIIRERFIASGDRQPPTCSKADVMTVDDLIDFVTDGRQDNSNTLDREFLKIDLAQYKEICRKLTLKQTP